MKRVFVGEEVFGAIEGVRDGPMTKCPICQKKGFASANKLWWHVRRCMQVPFVVAKMWGKCEVTGIDTYSDGW